MVPMEDFVTLTDENGNDVEFEFLDYVKYKNEEYVVLLPTEDCNGEVLIMKLTGGDVNDEEYFLSKHKCIHKDQKGDDLNIGQETKGNLSSQKDCAQDTVYYNFPCFHQYPSFNVSSNASPSETGV